MKQAVVEDVDKLVDSVNELYLLRRLLDDEKNRIAFARRLVPFLTRGVPGAHQLSPAENSTNRTRNITNPPYPAKLQPDIPIYHKTTRI